jgi:peptide deformylase
LASEPKAFINPEIIWRSKELTEGVPKQGNKLEGCLSVPGYYGLVRRAQKIKLRWQMANGKWQMAKFSGFLATVIQHEMDHLNGILFIDCVLEQGNQLYQLEKEGGKEILRGVEI